MLVHQCTCMESAAETIWCILQKDLKLFIFFLSKKFFFVLFIIDFKFDPLTFCHRLSSIKIRRSATSMSDLLSPETSSERDSVSIEMKLAKSGRSQNVSAIDSSTNTDAANLPSLGQYHDQQMDQQMDHYDELLLGQFGANLMSSPVFNGNMNFPHMNFLPALSNGIFDLGSNPNTPQLPPMESHIQSTLESAQSVPLDDPILPNMPLESDVANVPPPSDDMNWQMFCQLIGQKNDDAVSATNVHGIAPPSLHIQNLLSVNPMESSNADPIPFAHQSQVVGGLSQTANGSAVTVESLGEQQPDNLPQTKRRKIKSLSPSASDEENASPMSPVKKRKLNDGSPTSKREANSGRGRPRKKSVAIKEEEDGSNAKRSKKRGRKKKSENRTNSDSNDELDMEQFLTEQLKGESFVGIRTEDGEVRIQIPPSSSRRGTGFSKVKFTVFGNACSDKIEDILQPKKRTRYVRGLSEDEKKQRRYAVRCTVPQNRKLPFLRVHETNAHWLWLHRCQTRAEP